MELLLLEGEERVKDKHFLFFSYTKPLMYPLIFTKHHNKVMGSRKSYTCHYLKYPLVFLWHFASFMKCPKASQLKYISSMITAVFNGLEPHNYLIAAHYISTAIQGRKESLE